MKKVKNKNVIIFIISYKKGLLRVLNLIKGKLKLSTRFKQISNILNNFNFKDLNEELKFSINNNCYMDNYWLAGFADADASFQIKIINRINRKKTRNKT